MTSGRTRAFRIALATGLIAALVGSVIFGLRCYGSWQLLRSAYALEAPDLGSIRAWMTFGYVARLFNAPEAGLAESLHLAPGSGAETTLRELARREGVTPLVYTQRVQQALAALAPKAAKNPTQEAPGWFSGINETMLAWLLVYGYPALAAILVVGSIGVPLPDGLLTAAAGSLIAQHRMAWLPAGFVAVGATVAGDMVGYYLGAWLGDEFLSRRGKWIGYTPSRRLQAQALFARWGWLGVLLSRTLASSVSSVVNLVAGAGRYRPTRFLGAAAVGRVLWTSAYLGLGYGVGGALEAANGFLANLTGLLVVSAAAITFAWMLLRGRGAAVPTAGT